MRLSFLGAAHQVTGSCFLLEAAGKKIVVDCGMEQGPDIFERQTLAVSPPEVDFVLLTHAHIDHSGLLPLMYKEGFRGKVFCTTATERLCAIMLKDSAHIQESEAEWKNRKAQRGGGDKYEPLYTIQDAENTMRHFVGRNYNEKCEISEGISIRFTDAGHLLGSAHIEVWVTENGVTKKILFSGDIGNHNMPLLNEPTPPLEADYIVMESTYGDRLHEAVPDCVQVFADIIQNTFDLGGKVIIPAFAVGRTQELLYYLRQIKERNLVKGYGDFTIYLDSPLAIEATNIFKDMGRQYYDEEATELLNQGVNPIGVKGLVYSLTSDDSKLINFNDDPCVIISASGMCEAGRIRHHLKHNLWQSKNTVLFAGFQVPGTLGHTLLSGAKQVKLFQEVISVNAKIMKLPNTSAHADKAGLFDFLSKLQKKPQKVFVVHGEDRVCELMAGLISDKYGFDAVAPHYGEEYDLLSGVKLKSGSKRVKKEKPAPKKVEAGSFGKLLEAWQRLGEVIEKCRNLFKKDHIKMANQIEELCNRWDKK